MSKVKFCNYCGGNGTLSTHNFDDGYTFTETCPSCHGIGWVHHLASIQRPASDYARALDAAVLAVEKSFNK